jgi:long-chain fatty acid transport protein
MIVISLITISLAICATFASPARAGGLYVNEFSTTSQSNSGAGRGAWVPDASATLHNPAAMTRLDDHGFAGGFSLLVGQIHFDSETGSNGGNQAGVAPIASFSYAHKVSDRVRLGFSFFSISGSILSPSNNWAGRSQVTDLSLLTISMTPTVAVRITDWLSVGGGPVVTYGVLNWDLREQVNDNFIRLNDLDDWEASGRIGLLLHPTDDLSLSVFYNSETDLSLNGEFNGPANLNPSLDLDLPLAQFVEVSGYWQATEKVGLLATFNWEDWSKANNLSVQLGSAPTINATTGFRDTYKVAVGANYQFNEDWLLQTGLSYDTSALQNKNRIAALPIDEQIRFALGGVYALSESTNLGLSFVYINLGQGEIRTGGVEGDYQRNHAFVFGLSLAFKKLPWAGKWTYERDPS